MMSCADFWIRNTYIVNLAGIQTHGKVKSLIPATHNKLLKEGRYKKKTLHPFFNKLCLSLITKRFPLLDLLLWKLH